MKHTWLIKLATGLAKVTGYVPALLFFKPKITLAPGATRRLPKAAFWYPTIGH
jgi:hypothetical protein